MREIKFRVWNDDSKRMDVILITNENCGCGWIQSPKTHFMQFTGLYDRTGKEIYEGDIIRFWNYIDTHEVVFEHNHGWHPDGIYNRDWWKMSEVVGNKYEGVES